MNAVGGAGRCGAHGAARRYHSGAAALCPGGRRSQMTSAAGRGCLSWSHRSPNSECLSCRRRPSRPVKQTNESKSNFTEIGTRNVRALLPDSGQPIPPTIAFQMRIPETSKSNDQRFRPGWRQQGCLDAEERAPAMAATRVGGGGGGGELRRRR